MPYTYIIECADGSYYTGSTWDLSRRFAQHIKGMGARFTAKHRPVRLVYHEEFSRIDEAFYREKQIQNWSHAKKQALINGNFQELKKSAKKIFEKRLTSVHRSSSSLPLAGISRRSGTR